MSLSKQEKVFAETTSAGRLAGRRPVHPAVRRPRRASDSAGRVAGLGFAGRLGRLVVHLDWVDSRAFSDVVGGSER